MSTDLHNTYMEEVKDESRQKGDEKLSPKILYGLVSLWILFFAGVSVWAYIR